MTQSFARSSLVVVLAALAFGLLGETASRERPAPRTPAKVVYVAGAMPETALLALHAAAEAHAADCFLLDSVRASAYLRAHLAGSAVQHVVPLGSFAESRNGLERRLDASAAPPKLVDGALPTALWRELFPRAEQVVLCPAAPRAQLLQAACLAGTLHAPLLVLGGQSASDAPLRQLVAEWGATRGFFVGTAQALRSALPGLEAHCLPDADAVAAARLKVLSAAGPVEAVVVANPADARAGQLGMSTLAPLVAARKRAQLLLTNAAGDDAEALVLAAVRNPALRRVDTVLLVADLKAIPMGQRPNPIPKDKDPLIEMEPLTPSGNEPFSFSIGRLFHDDPAVIPLLLAREARLARADGPRRALVASNPGGAMRLLEAFSRSTVNELRNAGYETTAFFGKEVNGDDLRRLLPEHDVFLWEGHHNPLINDFALPSWDEPLPPSFVFLQSCLALKDYKAQPLLSRGAIGVVGSSTRTYSASGGACSLAFFDALLYDDETLGGALRQAKNFLLAYALLKEKRLGKDATRTGANLRAAWAFTLWGDPMLRLPRPALPDDARPAVRHEVHGDTIVVYLPVETHDLVTSTPYQAAMMPNARLAGLLRKDKDEESLALVPFVFAEVHLPRARPGLTPHLHGKVPASQYVFTWDARRAHGYLLVAPGSRTDRELRFHVEWTRSEEQVTRP